MNRPAGTPISDQPPRLVRAAIVLYAAALRLYPRRFAATFGAEMTDVFILSLWDAAAKGAVPLWGLFARELAELPLALIGQHLIERRKETMTTLSLMTARDIRFARLVARGLSLVLALFALSVFLFNEDVRQETTLPTLVFGALTLGLLIAWRWEKAGGLAVMLASPLLFLSIWLYWAGIPADTLVTPRWPPLLFGAGAAAAFAALGWLFVSVGQHAGTVGERSDTPRGGRRSLLVIGFLGLVALVLLVGSIVFPAGQRIEVTVDEPLPAAYRSSVARLRVTGAVVGVGSPTVSHPTLSIEGVPLDVDGASVIAYSFADMPAAEAAAALLTDEPGWLFLSESVLFAYTGEDPATVSTLTAAFGPALNE